MPQKQRGGLGRDIGFRRTTIWTKFGDWTAKTPAKIKFWHSDSTRLSSNWASLKD